MLRDVEMLSLLLARKPKHSLARPFYIDEGAYQVDLQQIWYREWIFVGPSCEIPKTGNYVTLEIGEYSVIVVRGADKEIRAVHNSCRHRGARICSAARGSAPKLVCPYHQWTYELDGSLLWARDMGPDFDPKEHGLKSVHCRVAEGMIFVCLAEVAPAFDLLAEKAKLYFGPHGMEDLKVAHESSIIEKGNWKLVMENNRECYHCSGCHPALTVTFDDNPAIGGSGAGVDEDPSMQAHRQRCEAAGLPSEFFLAPSEQWRMVRVPLVGEGVSYTRDGKEAVAKTVGSVPIRNAGSLLFFHYPNTWNHFLSDTVLVFRVLPRGPQETEVTTKWLVHKDAVEGVDYDLERLTDVWIATNDEDRQIVELNQQGINSPAYEPGPYSATQETGVIQFVDWYANTIASRLTGRRVVAAE